MSGNGIKYTKEEKRYLIYLIIFSVISALILAVLSVFARSYPGYFIGDLLDFFRRFFCFVILIVLFFYPFVFLLKFGMKRMNWKVIVFLVATLLSIGTFSFTIVKEKIDEGYYRPFGESVSGGIYLWNNQSSNGCYSQDIFVVFIIWGDEWFRPWPTDFILDFNSSKYSNCTLSTVNFKGGTNPIVRFYNNNSHVNVSWREADFVGNKDYLNHLWIHFNLTWESNLSFAYPSHYEIMVDGPYGLIDVCKGLLCHNPGIPSFHSKNWGKQVFNINKYSCEDYINI